METLEFEKLVRQAISEIPAGLRQFMDNVDVLVDERPSNDQLVGSGIEKDQVLLGLYEGLPLTEREDYGNVLPDRITIFQEGIEGCCTSEEEILAEVRETVVHEIAHHFGISDERLEELGI